MLGTIFGEVRTPILGFDRLSREIDRLFQNSVEMLGGETPFVPDPGRRVPGLNIWREGNGLVVEAELPGFRMQDLEVELLDGTLVIRGERSSEAPDGARGLRVERSVGRFERALRLPEAVDGDRVSATLRDGVLRVSLPVAEAARPRRVEISGAEPALQSGEATSLPAPSANA